MTDVPQSSEPKRPRLRRLHTTLSRRLQKHRLQLVIGGIVFFSCAYFFQGGGWNQNAHFATVVALVEDHSLYLDDYRASTGDLARADEHLVSAKPIATALVATPAYLLSRLLPWPVDKKGDKFIIRAYVTSLFTSGLALTLLAVLLFQLLRRRLSDFDATIISLAIPLATPLFPNSTMLNSHALVSLTSMTAYALLEWSRHTGQPPTSRRLFFAGMLAAAPAAFEYMTAVILLPLGCYALWQCRPRRSILWFAAGIALIALIPLLHHSLVYGSPFETGYEHLTTRKFANDAAIGFMGFNGISLHRLFHLTFGQSRGIFFLSPFLLAAVWGLIRLLRHAPTRAEGLVTGSLSWGVLLLVASLVYWHSGSATGSRYALLFVPFSAIPLAAVFPDFRIGISVAIVWSFAVMLLATSVCAIPPTPRGPVYENVIEWWWRFFSSGELAQYQYHVLAVRGVGSGNPTLPFAFNLGQLIGISGIPSLFPYLAGIGLGGATLAAALFSSPCSRVSSTPPSPPPPEGE